MNLYTMVGSGIGSAEAAALSLRLSAWHDAMVAHERKIRVGRIEAACDDECPHAEAPALWNEAVETFGVRAQDLTFLRTRAMGGPGGRTRWASRHAARAVVRAIAHDDAGVLAVSLLTGALVYTQSSTRRRATERALDDILDVSRPPPRGHRFLNQLVSMAGAVGIALLLPLVILLIGVPLALAARAIVRVAASLLARITG